MSSDVTFTSAVTVSHVQHCGDDLTLCRAAWQSTREPPPEELTPPRQYGLLRSLVRNRHGTPLEAGFLTVSVHAPLFVLNQVTRHRHLSLGADDLSFSVGSGRYGGMEPVFWVPPPGRPMVPVGGFRPMSPEFVPMSTEDHDRAALLVRYVCGQAWAAYLTLIEAGVCNEVARVVLPQSTYSRWWMSGNLRAWLNFLSLRTKDPRAEVVSHVQLETASVGQQVEGILAGVWPLLAKAWDECGRTAP